MAKESGLGMTVTIDDAAGPTGRDLSNDITNLGISTPRSVYDWTGVDVSAMERGLGLADASFDITSVFNDGSNEAHAVFRTIPSTTVPRTVAIAHSGQTLSCECYGTDYNLTRAADGNLTASTPFVLQNGVAPTWGTS